MEANGKLLGNASLTSFTKKFLEKGYDNFEYIVGLEEGRLREILEEEYKDRNPTGKVLEEDS